MAYLMAFVFVMEEAVEQEKGFLAALLFVTLWGVCFHCAGEDYSDSDVFWSSSSRVRCSCSMLMPRRPRRGARRPDWRGSRLPCSTRFYSACQQWALTHIGAHKCRNVTPLRFALPPSRCCQASTRARTGRHRALRCGWGHHDATMLLFTSFVVNFATLPCRGEGGGHSRLFFLLLSDARAALRAPPFHDILTSFFDTWAHSADIDAKRLKRLIKPLVSKDWPTKRVYIPSQRSFMDPPLSIRTFVTHSPYAFNPPYFLYN